MLGHSGSKSHLHICLQSLGTTLELRSFQFVTSVVVVVLAIGLIMGKNEYNDLKLNE